MKQYYLDFETTGLSPKDKIITIQYQELNPKTGVPKDDLTILREWESSEEEIFKTFARKFDFANKWAFVPIGMNLMFELSFIRQKARDFLGIDLPPDDFYRDKPRIDIRSTLVMLNEGEFIGSGLDNFTHKAHGGQPIPDWYEKKEYGRIVEYVEKEAVQFVAFYQRLLRVLPKALQIEKKAPNYF